MAPKIWKFLKKQIKSKTDVIAIITILILSYAFYEYTFKITHKYNQYPAYYWILRNIFFNYVALHLWAKIIFFIITIYTCLALWVIKFKDDKEKHLYLIFSALSLAPFWLIEVRYAIIPIVLLNLYRTSKNKYLEGSQFIYGAALSGIILYTIINTTYFP